MMNWKMSNNWRIPFTPVSATVYTPCPQKSYSKPNVFLTKTLKIVNKFPSDLAHSISD